ncbi:MAG: hypothetical protein A2736_00130 [Candidatus Yanofskybacteria bacterium RIFCSPHIGHO2_01_FULL_41_27]|uniref:Serine protease n=1 Tax=Candidatus Yanofskybacteria bacterium RIFCSPHIGHO2_01_FULL_41_27 TaxID=1802662 RepID=A0A1F8ED58_9BACT|nr:MAG: hypothetical protein A2736_00130 [Candidatus Yanofskybacteria bacterium RIFCSPHIGHO2_01_FULL_41_27]
MNSKDARYSLFLLIGVISFFIFVVIYGFWQESKYSFLELNRVNVSQNGNTYVQDFKTEAAAVTKEIGNQRQLSASAFILDKQKGWFATAAHFVGKSGKNNFKLFYNGVVYKSAPVKVSSRADVAIIKIVGDFSADNFAEPYKFSSSTHIGEKVFIRGFHLHPITLWTNKKLTGILRNYYEEGDNYEIVFDDLSAFVVRVDAVLNLPATPDRIEASNLSAKSCIELRTEEDHQYSFGGLSGGPIVNMKNELVGIVFSSNPNSGYFIDLKKRKLTYVSSDVLYAVPAQELKNLKLSWLLN